MRPHTSGALVLAAVGAVVLLGGVTRGHTPIASRFTYNEHIFPIFERQCGSCHVEGGIGPMSLLTYREAYPWTQSIREEILGLRMPPWKAEDGFGSFSNGHVLPAHEMDMILEWSAGGYPQGPRNLTPPAPPPSTGWNLDEPTVAIPLPEPFVFDAATSETVRYFVLPTDLGADRSIRAIDVLPESRAVVRHVSVYVDTSGEARAADAADDGPGFASGFESAEPVAVWWPGQQIEVLDGIAYPLPAGADLVARILYKKTWITEGLEFTDRTQLGLHLADGDADAIEQTVVDAAAEPAGRELTFRHVFDDETTLLALLPEVAVGSSELQVEGVLPDGSRQPLLLIREPDPAWPTRYWLEEPLDLPAGSALQVTATLEPGAGSQDVPSLFASDAPMRLLVDHTNGTPVAD